MTPHPHALLADDEQADDFRASCTGPRELLSRAPR